MSTPPKDPPQAKAAEDWDDLLGEAKQSGISPDMARALLKMNPAMRAQGVNTAWVVNQSQDAQHKKEQKAAGSTVAQKAPTASSGKASPTVAGGGDVYQLIDGFAARAQQDEQQIDAQIKKLQEAKHLQQKRLLEELMQALAQKDPELLSPFTQQALTDKREALAKLGFSVKGFVEFRKAGPNQPGKKP